VKNEDLTPELEAHMEDFWFSSARITYIRDMRNQGHYFTADIAHPNDYDTTVSVEGYWTDLPSVHYDWDDDPYPFGNGYADESEVTVTDPTQLIAGRNYDFVTIFRDMTRGNTSGNLEVNSQRSYWSWFFWEYNVYDGQYELLATPDYNTHGLLTNIKGIAFALSGILEDKGFIQKQASVDEFTLSSSALEDMYKAMVMNHDQLQQVDITEIPATITFHKPQSRKNISLFLKKSDNFQACWYDALAFSQDGKIITLGSKIDSKDSINEVVLENTLQQTKATLLGVYSIRGVAKVKGLPTLQADPDVFLISTPTLEALQQAKLSNKRVKAPPSVFWQIWKP